MKYIGLNIFGRWFYWVKGLEGFKRKCNSAKWFSFLVLIPMLATAQIHEAKGNVYEVKGEFKAGFSISSGCGCLTWMNAQKICCEPFDCKVNAKGEIYCKRYCDVGAQCNTFDGTAWIQSDCCYDYVGRKDEQCVFPLPALSFFKIKRQVYRA